MFAYGNTLMEDFLEDLQVTDSMHVLMLGVGDIRYMLKTVAGLESRPHAAGCPNSLGYLQHLYVYILIVCLSLCLTSNWEFVAATLGEPSPLQLVE